MPDSVDVYGPVPQNCFSGTRRLVYEGFAQIPGLNADITVAYNPNFETLGTNGVSADHTFNAGGGFNLASHGGSTDSAILLPHLDTKQTVWSTSGLFRPDNSWQWGCRIKTPASLTNITLWLGLKLTNTPTVATDDDQVIIKYVNGTDTNWQSTYSIAGTDVTADTGSGGLLAASTLYRVWFLCGADRIVRVYVNDNLLLTTTALTAAAALIPYIGILSATSATAKTLVVRDCWFSVPCN